MQGKHQMDSNFFINLMVSDCANPNQQYQAMLKTHTKIKQWKLVCCLAIAIALLITIANGQSECIVSSFPINLPLVSMSDNITLDLSEYFTGNNLSFVVTPASSYIKLKEPLQRMGNLSEYTLGDMVSVDGWEADPNRKAIDNYYVSMLIHNQKQEYVVYYGSIGKWESGFSKKVVSSVNQSGNCYHHIMDANGNFVIHCQEIGKGRGAGIQLTFLLFGNVNTNQIVKVKRPLFAKEVYYPQLFLMKNGLLLRVYLVGKYYDEESDRPKNSYFELWNITSQQMVAMYDRGYFGLSSLSITDISEGGTPKPNGEGASQIFILDYLTGIYKFQLNDRMQLEATGYQPLQFYEQLSIFKDRTVISRKNSLIESSQSYGEEAKITKYQMLTDSLLLDIQINQQFTVIHTFSQLVVYRKGYSSPYQIRVFPSPLTQFILFGSSLVIFRNNFGQVTLEPIIINQPNLYLQMLNASVKLTVQATSIVFSSLSKCNATTQVKVFRDRNQQKIFKNRYDSDLQEMIFVNRPGQTELPLEKYGSGNNITYEVITFGPGVNFGYEVDKLNLTETHMSGTNLSQFEIGRVDSFGNVLRVEYINLQVFYFQCDKGDPEPKESKCKQTYFENIVSTPSLIKFYIIVNPNPLFPSVLVEAMVLKHRKSTLTVRKIYRSGGPEPQKVCEIKYQTSSKSIGMIDDVEVFAKDDGTLALMVLLQKQKQIDYYQLMSSGEEGQGEECRLLRSITQQSVGGYFHPQSILKIRQEVHSQEIHTRNLYTLQLLVKQFNELYILTMDINNLEDVSEPLQIGKSHSITVDDVPATGDYEMQVQFPHILIIGQTNNTLAVYTVQGENKIKFTQELPLYGQNLTRMHFKVPNSRLIAVNLKMGEQQSVVAFYDIGTLTSFYSYYGEINAAETRNYQRSWFFGMVQPTGLGELVLVSFPKKIPKSGILKSHMVYPSPKLRLTLTSSTHSIRSESFYIQLKTRDDSLTHLVNLTIANYPDNITFGSNYPYATPRYQLQQRVIIETNRWFKGNVLTYKFSCDDCASSTDQQSAPIQVWDKIHEKQHIPAYQSIDSILVGKTIYVLRGGNLIYTTNIQTKTLGKSYILPTDSKCTQMSLTDNWFLDQKLLLVLCSRMLFGLSLVSEVNGGNVVIEFLLPTFGVKLHYHNNIAVVLGFDGAYIISIPSTMNVRVADFIPGSELGRVCAFDFERTRNYSAKVDANSYLAIVTLCDQGVALLGFTVAENAIVTYTQRQKISIVNALNKNNLNIPSNSKFINTIITKVSSEQGKQQDKTVRILTVMDKFNTFEWDLFLHNDFADKITLLGVYNRFSNYEVTGKISNLDEYVLIEMVDSNDTIQGLYYTEDFSKSNDVKSYFIIEAVPISKPCLAKIHSLPNTTERQFETAHQIIASGLEESYTKIYEISNTIRLRVKEPQTLYQQNLLIIPSTPFNAKTVVVKLSGLELFKLEWWEIILIVIIGGLLLGLVWLAGVWLYRYIDMKRKMIPLLRDFEGEEETNEGHMEDEERRIEEEIEAIKRRGSSSRNSSELSSSSGARSSDSKSSEDNYQPEAAINQSERGSLDPK